MTDAAGLKRALDRVDAACPCASGIYYCNASMPKRIGCKCTPILEAIGPLNACSWSGHAAVRAAMREAAKWAHLRAIPTSDTPFHADLAAILGPPEREHE